MGRRPYLGRSRKEIRDQILMKQVQVKKHEIPEGWSLEAADFINRVKRPSHYRNFLFLILKATKKKKKLKPPSPFYPPTQMIQRKPQHRLGTNGPEEVKNHPWLKSFPWNKLMNKEIDAPFVPSVVIKRDLREPES